MSNVRFWTAVILLVWIAPGCTCTEEERDSVRVSVVDEHDETVFEATVRYRVDDDPDYVDCELLDHVEEWACGVENDGVFDIEVSAEGFEPQHLDVAVHRDHCHVSTEDVTVVLEASP